MIVRMREVVPFDFGGLEIRDYTAGQPVRSLFALISVPPGSVHPEALSLRSDKYYFVVTGSVEFIDAGEACVLSAGDFCLVPQGQRFSEPECWRRGGFAMLCSHTELRLGRGGLRLALPRTGRTKASSGRREVESTSTAWAAAHA